MLKPLSPSAISDANKPNPPSYDLLQQLIQPMQVFLHISFSLRTNLTFRTQHTHDKHPRCLNGGNPLAVTSPRSNDGRLSPFEQQYASSNPIDTSNKAF